MSALEAASLPENYFTVWNNRLRPRASRRPAKRCSIHGGSGGIGLAAIQLAHSLRRDTITTVGSAEKAAFCKTIGADHAINYREQDFAVEVAALTAKRGVDVILDIVGGDYIEKNLKSLALEGRMAIIAFLQGSKVTVDWRHIMMKRLTVTGSTLRASPAAAQGGAGARDAREGLAAVRRGASSSRSSIASFRWPKRPMRIG